MKDDRINTLAIENSSELGGANFSLIGLAEGLKKEKYHPTVICPSDGPMCRLCEDKGVSFEVIPGAMPSKIWPIPFWLRVHRLKKLALSINAKLIHANATSVFAASSVVANKLSLPSIMHVRCYTNEEDFLWLFRHVPKPSAVIFISNYIRQQCYPFLEKIIPTGCIYKTIYNPIEYSELNEKQSRSIGDERVRYEGHKNAILVSLIANFHPNKGHVLAINSLKALLEKGHNVKFLFAGQDVPSCRGFKLQMVEMCKSLSLEKNVEFLGFRNDVQTVLSISDIILCSSKNEAFGRTCAEAMIMGKPVVATKDGGHIEQVVHGDTGFLVTLDNQKEMVLALETLIASPELRKKMGNAGRVRARSLFTQSAHVREVVELYDTLISTT